jgi:hypothetical protein
MHLTSGKDLVPLGQPSVPASHLTSIVPPVGVHIEAAQSAKSPGQSRKPSTVPCDITWGTARRIAPIRNERSKAYRNMFVSPFFLYILKLNLFFSCYPIGPTTLRVPRITPREESV